MHLFSLALLELGIWGLVLLYLMCRDYIMRRELVDLHRCQRLIPLNKRALNSPTCAPRLTNLFPSGAFQFKNNNNEEN
jgi:hypothetical protein